MKDPHRDHQIALRDGQDRRARAIELALFNAKTLNCYVHKSRRTLNDLRTIRRLILNERITRTLANQTEPKVTTHFTGRVFLSKQAPAAPALAAPLVAGGPILEAPEIYRVYFHGPAYQVIQRASWDGRTMTAQFAAPLPDHHHPKDRPLAIAPRLIELCFQTAGLYEMVVQQRMGLPLHVDRVSLYRAPELAEGPLFAVVTPAADAAGFDAEVVDGAGNCYLRLSGYRTVAFRETGDLHLLHTAAVCGAPVDLYWLERTEADVPAGDDWLGPGEAHRLEGMRFPKRRADWRLRGWTAKCAVVACLGKAGSLGDIEIQAAPSGAPEVLCASQPVGIEISISHRAGVACCAVTQRVAALGCDLELIEPRSRTFATDYFTVEEQALIAQVGATDLPHVLALLWSAKESALKALRVGLRDDTRSVSVTFPASSGLLPSGDDRWRPMTLSHAGARLHGWWCSSGCLVRTWVTIPPMQPPEALHAEP